MLRKNSFSYSVVDNNYIGDSQIAQARTQAYTNFADEPEPSVG